MKTAKHRDVSKFLKEFQQINSKSKGQAGAIYTSELDQLYTPEKGDVYNAICSSYQFGFIAGLHYAKNQRRK